MLDWLRRRVRQTKASAQPETDQAPLRGGDNTDASSSILSPLRARLSSYDRRISEGFCIPATDIASMPVADLVGMLLMIRLNRAAERKGYSLFAGDDRGCRMLAVLSACALQAGAVAAVTLMRAEQSLKIAPEALRDAVLTFAAVSGRAEEADWRVAFSDTFARASGELQRAAAATGGPEADFSKLLASLGMLEVESLAIGSEQDRKLDRIADAIVQLSDRT